MVLLQVFSSLHGASSRVILFHHIIFFFVSEVLSRGLNQLLLTGRMEPYALPRGFKLLSHLSFADDIIIFTRGTMRSVRHLFAFTGL